MTAPDTPTDAETVKALARDRFVAQLALNSPTAAAILARADATLRALLAECEEYRAASPRPKKARHDPA